jgi:hypothetical protein
VSYLEETLLRRVSGARIMVWSFVIGFGGVLPLLLYMALGPADGNPLGLGLLAMVAVPVGGVGVVVGLIAMLVQKFDRRGE